MANFLARRKLLLFGLALLALGFYLAVQRGKHTPE